MARKPPPFVRGKNDSDKNGNGDKKAFGGKKAAPFNNRKPAKRGK